MSSQCSGSCNSCSSSCSSAPESTPTSVKKVIGIVSGKGGVGKSLVTSLMAVGVQGLGKKAAILDADITGPSIPKSFGVTRSQLGATEDGKMIPATSATGIEIISSNLLLEDDTAPVIWRGPVIAGAVEQFWKDTMWGEIDYMFVDMPPGTGDVPLTVFQTLPVDGIIIVTSPQELVSMIVKKAVHMAEKMNIPIIGLVENMSYLECPDCKKKLSIFGESRIDEIAMNYGLEVLARIPITPSIASHVDAGMIEYSNVDFLDKAVNTVLAL